MAFLQPVSPRQPVFRAPAIVPVLIGVLTALHGARMLASPPRQAMLLNQYAFSPARYSHSFLAAHNVDPGNLWERLTPFVSYMGLHNDWTHLGMNCLGVLAFGPVVARRFGTALFLVFFMICGVAGALAYLASNWGSPEGMIGASGAISGVMGAAIRLLPGASPWADTRHTLMTPLFSRQVLQFSAVWAAINLLAGLTGLGVVGGGTVLVAWQAHMGGYVAGLVLAGGFDALAARRPVPHRA